ncbi:MAG: hypothetical protein ACLUIQ_09725 [Dialister invisus]
MIVIGALACGAAGLVAGCGGEKKEAAPAADKSAKPTKIVQGWMILSRRWDSVMTKVKSWFRHRHGKSCFQRNRDTH